MEPNKSSDERQEGRDVMNTRPTLRLKPDLETHCYFVAHLSKANVLWSHDDFRALCHRMLNGNGEHDFLMCYRTAQGHAKFSKAFRRKASDNIDWAFDTMCETQKVKTGIGFYPRNGDGESCWAALDFDAHDTDERQRAYAYAGNALTFSCLKQHHRLQHISGGGGVSVRASRVN